MSTSDIRRRPAASPTAIPDNTPRFVPTALAAGYLGLSPRTLEKLRVQGGGPTYAKFGRRVVYAVEDLDRWAAERRRGSTSEPVDRPA